ncbi:MAG: hypothetical protein JNJ71_19470 [Rubrivivax sp.]|nr:hypothetical protein [Rubrivivax sp.]
MTSTFLKHTAIGLAVFVVAAAAAHALRTQGLPAWQQAAAAPATVAGSSLIGTPSGAMAAGHSDETRLQVLLEGVDAPVALDQPVALPHGSRFRVRLGAAEAATWQLVAIGPGADARETPLWSATTAAGGHTTSPRLRLSGTRGTETLKVIRRSLDGRITTVRVFQLLHV